MHPPAYSQAHCRPVIAFLREVLWAATVSVFRWNRFAFTEICYLCLGALRNQYKLIRYLRLLK